jgi:hypothetical protein
MPVACMNAYMMVLPTNLKPRRLRSLLMASDSAVKAGTGLCDFQDQEFEQHAVVVLRHAPFFVVVSNIEWTAVFGPMAASHFLATGSSHNAAMLFIRLRQPGSTGRPVSEVEAGLYGRCGGVREDAVDAMCAGCVCYRLKNVRCGRAFAAATPGWPVPRRRNTALR